MTQISIKDQEKNFQHDCFFCHHVFALSHMAKRELQFPKVNFNTLIWICQRCIFKMVKESNAHIDRCDNCGNAFLSQDLGQMSENEKCYCKECLKAAFEDTGETVGDCDNCDQKMGDPEDRIDPNG
jgi:ribosomal protein L37AE/L43A